MLLRVTTILSLLLCPFAADAQDAAPAPIAQPAPAPKPKYSLPWGLRPGIAPTVVRSDSSLALTDPGTTFSSTLTAGYKFIPNLGLYGKAALTYYSPEQAAATAAMPMPAKAESATAFSNPLIFGLYTPKVAKEVWLPIFFGVTLPIGGGGGTDPDLPTKAAQGAGLLARSAMDNALFAVNYFTVVGGIGAAWVHDSLTLQGELTVLQLSRVRANEKLEPDNSRTNGTAGAHVGYAVIDMLTLSTELRYQRWLSEPTAVKLDPKKRDQMTVGVGARLNLPVGKVMVRPGIAYFHPVDDPMADQNYRVLTFDVPVLF